MLKNMFEDIEGDLMRVECFECKETHSRVEQVI